MWKRYS